MSVLFSPSKSRNKFKKKTYLGREHNCSTVYMYWKKWRIFSPNFALQYFLAYKNCARERCCGFVGNRGKLLFKFFLKTELFIVILYQWFNLSLSSIFYLQYQQRTLQTNCFYLFILNEACTVYSTT